MLSGHHTRHGVGTLLILVSPAASAQCWADGLCLIKAYCRECNKHFGRVREQYDIAWRLPSCFPLNINPLRRSIKKQIP